MLDTNICIALLRGGSSSAAAKFRQCQIDQVTLSSVTMAELQYGVAKSARPAHHEALLAQFCAPIAILPFDAMAAEVYGSVRTALEKTGEPIGPLDTMIASHALRHGLTLVTNNEREFQRVKNLRVENWLAS